MTNQTKHTPAPWNVERPFGEPGIYVSGPYSELIAKVWEENGTNTDANARLIAAAPELLAALRVAETLIAGDIVRDDAGCLDKVRAAIAKATGDTR